MVWISFQFSVFFPDVWVTGPKSWSPWRAVERICLQKVGLPVGGVLFEVIHPSEPLPVVGINHENVGKYICKYTIVPMDPWDYWYDIRQSTPKDQLGSLQWKGPEERTCMTSGRVLVNTKLPVTLGGFRILRVYETIDGETVDFDNMNAHPGSEHQQKVGDLCSKYHFKEVLWPTNCR